MKSKKNDFLSLKGNKLTEFEVICVNQDDNKFYYPMDYNIIRDNLFDKLLDIFFFFFIYNLNKP